MVSGKINSTEWQFYQVNNALLNFPVYCIISNIKFHTELKIRSHNRIHFRDNYQHFSI